MYQQQYVDTALWVSKFKPLLGMQLWCAGFWGSLNKKTQLPQTHFGQVAECYININWIPTIVASCWNSSSGGSSLATWFCSTCFYGDLFAPFWRHERAHVGKHPTFNTWMFARIWATCLLFLWYPLEKTRSQSQTHVAIENRTMCGCIGLDIW